MQVNDVADVPWAEVGPDNDVRERNFSFHGINKNKILAFVKMDEGYLSRLIEKFVAEGIIKKRRSRKDARVYDLSVSAKGKRIFSKLNASSDNEVRNLVLGIRGRDLQSLVNQMNNIRRILSRE